MPKLHRISEVAKMLGISTETIRYYESVGVIKPSRDEKNGYRYYGGWDIHMLARARLYRLYGFSLEDTAKMLGSPDIASVEDGLKKQEEILEQELIWKMNQLQRIRQERSNMAEIQNGMGKFRMEKNPAFYRLHMQEEYTANAENEIRDLVTQWTSHASFLFSTALLQLEEVRQGKKTFSFGFGVDEEYASLLNIEDSPFIEYIPSRMCVHTVIPSRSSIHLDTDLLEDAFRWMEKSNLRIQGDIVTRVVLMLRPDSEYFNWHQVWIPVEP